MEVGDGEGRAEEVEEEAADAERQPRAAVDAVAELLLGPQRVEDRLAHDLLEEVAEQYALFGGVSPINEQNRTLIRALRRALDDRGIDLPLHWGNRNWSPYVEDTMQELADAGFESRVQEVDLGDMDYAEDAAGAGVWRLDCRCGEAFVLREDDLSNGIDVLQCLSCSLWIRPLYCAQPEPDG